MRLVTLLSCLAGVVTAPACIPLSAAENAALLGTQTAWRTYIAYTWPAEATIPYPHFRPVAVGEGVSSPLPPADWMQPDFDDYGWPRHTLPAWTLQSIQRAFGGRGVLLSGALRRRRPGHLAAAACARLVGRVESVSQRRTGGTARNRHRPNAAARPARHEQGGAPAAPLPH